MASGFARVTLVGNLGKEPELRFAAGGIAVANLRVACTERVKKGDAWEEQTEWVAVVCFGKTAENAGQYLQKGRQIYAEGRMQTREWKDKDGNKRWSTEVIANQVLFLGSGHGEKKDAPASSAAEPPPFADNEAPF